jgi:hypothetical protein
MFTIDYSRKRVTGILAEIDRLKQSDFPYPHPRIAMKLLDTMFRNAQSVLEKVSPASPVSANEACSNSLDLLYVYVPILGFLLRSTNVRNAFEAYAPLLRLARSIMGADTKLIVSSEWEFSPFVYRAITDLPGFVLIGLPAPESSNPFLIPLAGHELGHSVWETERFSVKFKKQITDGILGELTNRRWEEYSSLYPQYKKSDLLDKPLLTYSTWTLAYTCALFQTEEIFCDFIGLRLFAESYLHAFTYMLSPGLPGQRPLLYPNITRRVAHLMEAAKMMHVEVSAEFKSSFLIETEPNEPTTSLLVSIADQVSASLVSELIILAQDFADKKVVPTRDSAQVLHIYDRFNKKIVPISMPQSLVDILNAGWEGYLDHNFWANAPQIKPENRNSILGDLILKSMEISEVYKRLEKKIS